MSKSTPAMVSDRAVAEAIIAHEAVACFCGTEAKTGRQPKPLVSCTGGVFWGKPGESWPVSADGEPLIPWLQIVCTEMDRLYGAFAQKQAVCFFLRDDFLESEAISSLDGGDFVVREYGLNDELRPLTRPRELKGHPFHRVTWKRCPDYPSISKYSNLFEREVYDSLCQDKRFKFSNRSGLKIGGWPTPVQQDQQYPGSCDLQIDMTENFIYGDAGISYLSRTSSGWSAVFECC